MLFIYLFIFFINKFQPLTIYRATQVAGLGSSTSEIRDKLCIHYLGMLLQFNYLLCKQ